MSGVQAAPRGNDTYTKNRREGKGEKREKLS